MRKYILLLLLGFVLGYVGWVTYDIREVVDSNGLPKYPKIFSYSWIFFGLLSGMFIRNGMVGLFAKQETKTS
jgi:hypothetical protein